mmetsp:Transcript_13120/g.25789  ORF Transcript_13120/g.25789 Transcript_13120/m.25789 type:complete len:398 (-) Transcript_13120:93-1286(-)
MSVCLRVLSICQSCVCVCHPYLSPFFGLPFFHSFAHSFMAPCCFHIEWLGTKKGKEERTSSTSHTTLHGLCVSVNSSMCVYVCVGIGVLVCVSPGRRSHPPHPPKFWFEGTPFVPSFTYLKEVNQSSRCGDANLHSLLEVSGLGEFGHASVYARVLDLRGFAEFVTLRLDLHSQLAGGGQHQNDGAVSSVQIRLGVDVHNRGQQERAGLPRPRLCNPDHVPTRQRHRPALDLNGRRPREPAVPNRVVDVRGERRVLERRHRVRNAVASHNGDLVIPSDSVHFVRGHILDCRVLVVEVLLEGNQRLTAPVHAPQARAQVRHWVSVTSPTSITATSTSVVVVPAASTKTASSVTATPSIPTTASTSVRIPVIGGHDRFSSGNLVREGKKLVSSVQKKQK